MNAPSVTEVPKRRFSAMTLVRIAISVGLVGWLCWHLDLRSVVSRLSHIHLGTSAMAVGLLAVDRLVCNRRWQILLAAREIYIDFWILFKIQMTSFFIGTFLPASIGVDVMRMIAVSRHTDRPIDALSASAVDRVVMVLTTFSAALVFSLLSAGRFFPIGLSWTLSILLFGFVVAGSLLAYTNVARLAAPVITPIFGVRITGKLQEVYSSVRAFRGHALALATCFALALFTVFQRVLITFVLARALGLSVDFVSLLLVLPIIWIVLMFPISIGNIGVHEGAYVLVLSQVGVEPDAALSLAVFEHVLVYAFNLPGAYFFFRHGVAATPTAADSGLSN